MFLIGFGKRITVIFVSIFAIMIVRDISFCHVDRHGLGGHLLLS
jgi:hypothetical protein